MAMLKFKMPKQKPLAESTDAKVKVKLKKGCLM